MASDLRVQYLTCLEGGDRTVLAPTDFQSHLTSSHTSTAPRQMHLRLSNIRRCKTAVVLTSRSFDTPVGTFQAATSLSTKSLPPQRSHRTISQATFKLLVKMPESRSTEPLVWVDCEMTGLDLSKDSIMSLACFVTDHNLQMLDHTGYEAVIHHTQAQMDAMGDWCKQHHGASGLTKACLDSSTTAETAATELLEYIQKYVPERRKALLAGNTVHADKAFLVQEPWTKVVKYLHHRIFDVSAIKEAARRWAPVEVLKKSPQKAGKHEAKADILESIEEAKYYKRVFFDRSG